MSTPIMRQYKKIKEEYKEYLVFFRLGDFYELFYEDAKIAAEKLNIVLTKRAQKDEDVPMAGIPHHTSEYYINKLVKLGYKLAICDQINSETNEEKIIKREVVEIITAGTITNENLIESNRNNFLIRIKEGSQIYTIGIFDITTNEFFIEEREKIDLKSYLEKINPSEILASQKEAIKLKEKGMNLVTIVEELSKFQAENIILEFFNLHSNQSIAYLNEESKEACASILEYIKYTKKQKQINIKLPKKISEKEEVELDLFTRRNLEITKTLQNQFEGSLLWFIDETKTAQGGRRIYKYLTNPIKNLNKINKRLDQIEKFTLNKEKIKKTRENLKEIPDFERILSKIILKKASPNQLYQLAMGSKILYEICEYNEEKIDKNHKLFNEILSAIDQDAPKTVNIEVQYIKENYNKELDEWKHFQKDIKNQIEMLETQYQTITKVNNLRIKETPLGFLVEINSANQTKLNYTFEIKQTLKNMTRYTTQELESINSKFNHCNEFIMEKEREIFESLCKKIEDYAHEIYEYSNISSKIDVYTNLAKIALDFNQTRPILTNSNEFEIFQGKHPILEKSFQKKGEIFVANDCNLEKNIMFMTGPNMAGKSTYLRQQAIICLMAHCGMFVPCEYAKIGLVDQIFSRISTNDDLIQGNSTFMIEMIEMSLTINRATQKSFIILDEVGRGTSVEEGLALAQAILEYLLNKLQARTIFATHYLCLGQLEHAKMQKKMLKIIENPLIFTYKLEDGVASKSYAIEVAKIAGMPLEIVQRAEELLLKN